MLNHTFKLSSRYDFESVSLLIRARKPKACKGGNQKLKLHLFKGEWVLQLFIVPTEWIEGSPYTHSAKRFKEGELLVCDDACQHRSDKGGYCYVDRLREVKGAILKAQKGALFDHPHQEIELEPFNYLVRSSVWGDVSRLPEEAQEVLIPLLELAGVRLAYSAGWRSAHMRPYKGLMQASTQSPQDALEALRLGWSPYDSSDKLDQEPLRGLKGKPAYRCPVPNGGRDSALGCSVCPIQCNGSRLVLASHH